MNVFQKAAFAITAAKNVVKTVKALEREVDRELRYSEKFVNESFIESRCNIRVTLNGETFKSVSVSRSYAKIPFNSIEWNKELAKYLEEIKKLPYEQLTLQQKKVAKWYTFDLKKLSRIEIYRELNSKEVIVQIAKKQSETSSDVNEGFVTDRKNVK